MISQWAAKPPSTFSQRSASPRACEIAGRFLPTPMRSRLLTCSVFAFLTAAISSASASPRSMRSADFAPGARRSDSAAALGAKGAWMEYARSAAAGSTASDASSASSRTMDEIC